MSRWQEHRVDPFIDPRPPKEQSAWPAILFLFAIGLGPIAIGLAGVGAGIL